MNITYKTFPAPPGKAPLPAEYAVVEVFQNGRHAGFIYKTAGGFYYRTKAQPWGELLPTIDAVKAQLEGDGE